MGRFFSLYLRNVLLLFFQVLFVCMVYFFSLFELMSLL